MDAPAPLPQMSTPSVDEAAQHGLPDRARIVGMVDGIRGEGAEIEQVVAAGFERSRHLLLQREARVVTANRDSHGWVLAPYSLKIRVALQ